MVGLVAIIHGAEEADSAEMVSLAAALDGEPRELFPEFLAALEQEDRHERPGGMTGSNGGDA